MNEKYDEDINENLWYQTLYTKYDELFSRITNERWMVSTKLLIIIIIYNYY